MPLMYNDMGDFMLYLSEIGFKNTKEPYFWSGLPFYKSLSEGNSLSLTSAVIFPSTISPTVSCIKLCFLLKK